jgi:hypothetical protein
MADQDCEAREGDRRRHCEMVISLSAKFEDFMGRYDLDRGETIKFRESQSGKIDALTMKVFELTRPYKIMIWILTIVSGAFLLNVFEFVKKAILTHLQS